MTSVPAPDKVRPPEPENTPDKVAAPVVGAIIVLVTGTEKAKFDASPFKVVSVPPLNTGLAVVPAELKATESRRHLKRKR
jgi:hypothetical protein